MDTCEERQAAYLERDAPAEEHVAHCPVCHPAQAELDEMRSLLADEAAWAEPSADLEDRLMAAVLATEAADAPVAPTQPAPAPAAAPVADIDTARRRRAQRRGRLFAMAAATAATAAAFLVGTVVSGGDELASPDATFALVSTELAPSAGGTVSVRSTDSGNEIVLDVRGLPRAPAGSYYQAWVKSPTRGLVPIGTFHTGADRVTLWSGVDAREYTLLTVTLEREDDDPASSGRRVLSADLR